MFTYTQAKMARFIDQANLQPDATEAELTAFLQETRAYGFRTAAIMTSWVPLATQILKDSETSIVASVGFPLGTYPTASKVVETRWSIENGRPDIEIDMVMNLSLLKSHRYREVKSDIRAVVEAAEGHTVKVIIEVPLLSPDEIVIASQIAESAGVDFIKTSTGFRGYPEMRASTPEDVRLIRKSVGEDIHIKIAGGVFNLEGALAAIEAGATRIGTIAGIPIVEGLKSL